MFGVWLLEVLLNAYPTLDLMKTTLLLFWLATALTTLAARSTVSLDGTWDIADSISAHDIPSAFPHTVPVPGLVNLAQPAFPHVDDFFSREHLANRIRAGLSPADWLTNYWAGKINQDRSYFWYRKVFHAPRKHEIALLRIAKAQFGTSVWLNGTNVGAYNGCFSASNFHLQDHIRWDAENTLIVRIGAHPAMLPDNFPAGSDFEKIKWTPGIYDSVSLLFCENPMIETIQVAPRIATGEVIVQTRVKNCGSTPQSTELRHKVKTWKGATEIAAPGAEAVQVMPGEDKLVTQRIRIPQAHLWTPDDPFLYVLESSTAGDSVKTRFGMREFQFDGQTRRAYLNGKIFYLRGSNITLHRFFEDPLCQDLPWNEKWVRKLLGEIPKEMHWNYFRFCIGPVPDRWLEICDEEGLLVQNEFFVWTGGPGWYKGYSRDYDANEMIRQYGDWMRDNWNHPSVAVWDANNETKNALFGKEIIPAVRPLDLSHRPWENSYNAPVAANDPVEDHPYLMYSGGVGKLNFSMANLEKMNGQPRPGSLPSSTNAPLINEYGWLWLNRDGTPTRLTEKLYPQLMDRTNVTARERLDLYSYLLAGKTEFWRAHRGYAGIIHFVYLTCSYPGVYTADHWADVRGLKLDPAFRDYMGEAFKPLGIYINWFQPTLAAGTNANFTVMLVNDYETPLEGHVDLSLETRRGRTLVNTRRAFQMPALGSGSVELSLVAPALDGTNDVVLKAVATPETKGIRGSTTSRRWSRLVVSKPMVQSRNDSSP